MGFEKLIPQNPMAKGCGRGGHGRDEESRRRRTGTAVAATGAAVGHAVVGFRGLGPCGERGLRLAMERVRRRDAEAREREASQSRRCACGSLSRRGACSVLEQVCVAGVLVRVLYPVQCKG